MSRLTQPYRKGAPRAKTQALTAMKRGRTSSGANPMDTQRAVQRFSRGARAGAADGARKARKARKPR